MQVSKIYLYSNQVILLLCLEHLAVFYWMWSKTWQHSLLILTFSIGLVTCEHNSSCKFLSSFISLQTNCQVWFTTLLPSYLVQLQVTKSKGTISNLRGRQQLRYSDGQNLKSCPLWRSGWWNPLDFLRSWHGILVIDRQQTHLWCKCFLAGHSHWGTNDKLCRIKNTQTAVRLERPFKGVLILFPPPSLPWQKVLKLTKPLTAGG